MKYLTLVATIACLGIVSCEAEKTQAPAVMAGSAVPVSGVGKLKMGKTGALILVTEEGEELCTGTQWPKGFTAGKHVRFKGMMQAVLPLIGESCMKLTTTNIDLVAAPTP